MDILIKHGATPIVDPKSQKNAQKMAPPQKVKVNERKITKPYALTVLRNGYYEPLLQDEYEKFLEDH